MKKISIVLIILLVLGLIYWVYSRDERSPRDEDLKLIRQEVADAENALYPLRQAVKEFNIPEDRGDYFSDIAADKKWDQEFVEELLEKNITTISSFKEATDLSVFQIPIPEKIGPDWVLEPLAKMRDVAELASIVASALFQKGAEKEAFEMAMRIVKFGYMIENSQGPLILYLNGSAIKEIGLERLRSLLVKSTLPPSLLENYIKELEKFKMPEKGFVDMLKLEYEYVSNAIELVLSEGKFEGIGVWPRFLVKYGHSFKPNQTKRIFAESTRFYINNISEPYNKVADYRHPEVKEFIPFPLIIFLENWVGKTIYSIFSETSLAGIHSKYRERIFSVVGTQLLLAMKSYQMEKKELPSSIEELVPQYFAEIPRDPFDGQPIRYSKEKKIIYSVGQDLIDSGGSEGKKWQEMKDPTFMIRF